jgi:hypothetical protein
VVGVVIVAGFLYLTRVPGPNPIPTAAVTAARDAGCTTVQTPVADPVRTHLQPGQAYTYPSEPATSGPHDPYPYPDTPAVFPAMPEETKLVHNLEHGFVVIDYRAGSEAPLPQDVVDTLTTYVQGAGHVFLTPHPSLPDGVALAMTYWNRIQTCPATITPDQARAVASGFVTAFECSNVAPEARNC